MPADIAPRKDPTIHRGRRAVVRLGVVVLVVAGVIAALVLTRQQSTTTAPTPVFKTVAITKGALSTSEQVDGTVVLSDVTDVLHRIAGQPSASSSASAPTGGATASRQSSGAITNASTDPCAPSSTSPGSEATTTTSTTTPATSTTDATTSTTVLASTTTSTAPPSTTSTTTPAAVAPTTTACVPTSTTTPRPSGSSTGGRSFASGGGTGAATGGGSSTGGGNSRVTQVVTAVVAQGTQVGLGSILYAVDSRPVVALSGPLPAWRTLQVGVSDGPDVAQLELSLAALGYDRDGTMTVDQHFDSHTKAAVERWQAGYGLDVTGSVTLGSVVFLRSAATVTAVNVSVGDQVGDGESVLTLAATSQQVVISVPTGDERFVVPGLAVRIGKVDGTVTALRSVTASGATTVEAVIDPSSPIDGAANGAAVKVTLAHDQLGDALLVPSAALASRLDGSYALQVVQPGGTTTWVTVQVVGVGNGSVAVKGDGISEGTQVLQPL